MREEIKQYLTLNGVSFNETEDYIEVNEKQHIHIHPIEDTYKYRIPYKEDKGDAPKDYFRRLCEENDSKGIRTIIIKPWEWNNNIKLKVENAIANNEQSSLKKHEIDVARKHMVLESMLLCACGKIKHRAYARDCEIKLVPSNELRTFLDNNSFYGYRSASLSLGCYLKKDKGELKKGTLLMIVTIGKAFYGRGLYDLEIIRSATLKHTQVVGGFSKIFKHFLINYPTVTVNKVEVDWNRICFYVDSDHSDGKSMNSMNFSFSHWGEYGLHNVVREDYYDEERKRFFYKDEMFNRVPMYHKWVMGRIKEGKIYSVYNAGNKTFIFDKSTQFNPMNNSTFINE